MSVEMCVSTRLAHKVSILDMLRGDQHEVEPSVRYIGYFVPRVPAAAGTSQENIAEQIPRLKKKFVIARRHELSSNVKSLHH